jgi:hypothetical protein
MDATSDRTWTGLGWTARIVENEDGGGWALAMTHDDHDEPALVVPWVMGRNKKDPKPLGEEDFRTQVKAAQDFLTRTQQQIRRAHRRTARAQGAGGEPLLVVFDLIPDEFEPQGELVATNAIGDEVGRAACPPSFKLSRAAAQSWVDGGFRDIYGDDG